MMDQKLKSQEKNRGRNFIQILFRWIWNFLSLPVGYVIAVFIIFTSERSPGGYWGDLKGKRGRMLASEWGDSILIAIILAMFIRTLFVQAFKIPSGSMIPTLIVKDRLMVNKLRYGSKMPFSKTKRLPGFSKPKRGDVIVFVYPVDQKRDFIKRLIGLGGETIQIKDGDIYVNGKLVEDPIIKNIYYYNNRGEYGVNGEEIEVPEGQYFVLGDNSGSSSDGRFWGFVPEANVIGRAELIYWPFKRMRIIK